MGVLAGSGPSAGLGLLHLGLQPLAARRADRMGEPKLRTRREIRLDTLPEVLVVPHLLAPGAHRQEALELLDVSERVLKRGDAIGELALQARDACADGDS